MKIIITILGTLLIMFITSFLLDLEIIQQQPVRQIIIYMLIVIQGYIGFKLYSYLIKKP